MRGSKSFRCLEVFACSTQHSHSFSFTLSLPLDSALPGPIAPWKWYHPHTSRILQYTGVTADMASSGGACVHPGADDRTVIHNRGRDMRRRSRRISPDLSDEAAAAGLGILPHPMSGGDQDADMRSARSRSESSQFSEINQARRSPRSVSPSPPQGRGRSPTRQETESVGDVSMNIFKSFLDVPKELRPTIEVAKVPLATTLSKWFQEQPELEVPSDNFLYNICYKLVTIGAHQLANLCALDQPELLEAWGKPISNDEVVGGSGCVSKLLVVKSQSKQQFGGERLDRPPSSVSCRKLEVSILLEENFSSPPHSGRKRQRQGETRCQPRFFWR